MGLIDAATAPLRYVINGVVEHGTEATEPLRDLEQIQAHVLHAVEAIKDATEQIEAHVEVIDTLVSSLVPLTAAVTRLDRRDVVAAGADGVGRLADGQARRRRGRARTARACRAGHGPGRPSVRAASAGAAGASRAPAPALHRRHRRPTPEPLPLRSQRAVPSETAPNLAGWPASACSTSHPPCRRRQNRRRLWTAGPDGRDRSDGSSCPPTTWPPRSSSSASWASATSSPRSSYAGATATPRRRGPS